MDTNTRSEINRALAKAIAYRDCGQITNSKRWAARLVHLLECDGILDHAGGWYALANEGEPTELRGVK